jgi:hypothetical protein
MMCYAGFGPSTGPLRSGGGYYAIGVLPDRTARAPIGMALVDGQDQDGRALWRLTIAATELPGLYVVVDRKFRLAHRTPPAGGAADRGGHCPPNETGRSPR